MNKDLTTYRLIIIGRVQDVGFRYWFSKLAISLDLNGYVLNKKNINQVEAIIQGNIQNILNITKKSKNGPKLAHVEEVISNKIFCNIKYKNFIVK